MTKLRTSLVEEIKIIGGPQMAINGHHICSQLFVYHLCHCYAGFLLWINELFNPCYRPNFCLIILIYILGTCGLWMSSKNLVTYINGVR